MVKNKGITSENTLLIIFIGAFLAAAMYYEVISAVVSSVLLVWLFIKCRKDGFHIVVNSASLTACVITLFYMISCFWATDRGLAVWGAVKYLPVLLFTLCLMQIDLNAERKRFFFVIPWIGIVMILGSIVLSLNPVWKTEFIINGRLGGFFQYPNTFASFLLVGFLILFLGDIQKAPKLQKIQIILGIILLAGIVMTGSKTVYILMIPAVFIVLCIQKDIKLKLLMLGILLVQAICLVLLVMGISIGGFTISGNISTLWGRLLYYKDAIPIIIQHPFGCGYLGYYFMQGSYQTGMYSVRWVHSDFIQILLDIGWIPTVMSVTAVIITLFSKKTERIQKIVLLFLLAHGMLDFDLEFTAMYFLILVCMNLENGKEFWIRDKEVTNINSKSDLSLIRIRRMGRKVFYILIGSSLSIVSLIIGIDTVFTYQGEDVRAAALYPYNTFANINLLTQLDDTEQLEILADKINSQNPYVALAWDAKANAAFEDGDFELFIEYKEKAISLAKYRIEEYEDYFEKLSIGVQLYLEAEDEDSAYYCLSRIAAIQDMIDEVNEQTSQIAYHTADNPRLEMSQEYEEYVEQLGILQ